VFARIAVFPILADPDKNMFLGC